MAEYIDKQTVIDTLDGLCDIVCQYSKKQRAFMCGACNLGSAFDVLQELPAADVVPVVRCKNCKHGTRLVCDLAGNEGIECRHGNIAHRLDWFCADGAKMDGEV